MMPSLYVHIPYCVSKCSYCDFFSVADGISGIPDEYVTSLLKEKEFYLNRFNIGAWRGVYVGGGTPSLLSSRQIHLLMQGIFSSSLNNSLRDSNSFFSQKPEVTFEANPADITKEFLCECGKAGVSRLSLGIQSFSEEALSFVSRRSNAKSIENALNLISQNWRGIFSADLIAGLPRETPASFAEGLCRLLELRPQHISLYSLTIESGTRLGDAVLSNSLPYDYDAADEMWLQGRDILLQNGYEQYEVSNFCLPGYECRHNMTYWQQQDYIGIGAGAVGTVYDVEKICGLRFSNTTDRTAYCNFWNSHAAPANDSALADASASAAPLEIPAAIRQVERLDRATLQFEFFMMGLRALRGVCRETYIERFGADFSPQTLALFAEWQRRGLANITAHNEKISPLAKDSSHGEYRLSLAKKTTTSQKHYYSLTEKGILFLNEFLEKLEI